MCFLIAALREYHIESLTLEPSVLKYPLISRWVRPYPPDPEAEEYPLLGLVHADTLQKVGKRFFSTWAGKKRLGKQRYVHVVDDIPDDGSVYQR